MYFPIGWPKIFKVQKESEEPLIHVVSNRDRSLFAILSSGSVYIWFCKPSVQIYGYRRCNSSLKEHGLNLTAEWNADATALAVVTDKGFFLLYKVTNLEGGQSDSLYSQKNHKKTARRDYDSGFLGSKIPNVKIVESVCVPVQSCVTSLTHIRDEMMVSTVEGLLLRLKWDGTFNRDYSVDLKKVPFSTDLQRSSRAIFLDSAPSPGSPVHAVQLEYSPLMTGFGIVLSDGRGAFLTAPSTKYEPSHIQGVWAPDLRAARCVFMSNKYRLAVFGCESGVGAAYSIDTATGGLQLSHRLQVASRDYPDARQMTTGAITTLKATPDECAIMAAWEKGGVALWSVFGSLLFCSLQSPLEFDGRLCESLCVKSMVWGADGYHLWIIKDRARSASGALHTSEDVADPAHAGASGATVAAGPTTAMAPGDFMQMQFAKAAIAANPCASNHMHMFLHSEDRLYVATVAAGAASTAGAGTSSIDGGVPGGFGGSSNHLSSKQWEVVLVQSTYLSSNWPVKFAAIDERGSNIVIAGRLGLAHYSLISRRWKIFGNESQEKEVAVCGGLCWWKEFVCAGCFSVLDQRDEIRLYPRSRKLDNTFCTSIKVPFQILLINIVKNFVLCLCTDSHIMLFVASGDNSASAQGARAELTYMQEVNVGSWIPHPLCVSTVTLTSMRTEIVPGTPSSTERAASPVSVAAEPESILLNVAGKVLVFQRDRTGPQPKESGGDRQRPLPFANPIIVASCVENVWTTVSTTAHRGHAGPLVPSGTRGEDALWLSCGSQGMKVWLPLPPPKAPALAAAHHHSFMSKRIMLPFEADACPLAVLFEDGVILGAASDTMATDLAASSCVSTPTFSSSPAGTLPSSFAATTGCEATPYALIEKTSHIYLHHILRQLLRRNLGYHALEFARCFISLPYFTHILELLLHEVLEEEATSREPIPDPLLPRVVEFCREFLQYRQVIVHCARKTEVALWDHLFSTVGSPKILFEECLADRDLDTAASYLIILQSLEKPFISRQHATLLLEAALEEQYFGLARDLVRFLSAIDPSEAEADPTTRSAGVRYGNRFTPPPLAPEDQTDAFTLNKAPLARNVSLGLGEGHKKADRNSGDSSSKAAAADTQKKDTAAVKRRNSTSSNKDDDQFVVANLLSRHARKLLSACRLRDLAIFAANLEDYELVSWLRKERQRAAKVDNFVQALKQLLQDFQWPMPILTHSAYYRTPAPTDPVILKSRDDGGRDRSQSAVLEMDLGNGAEESGYSESIVLATTSKRKECTLELSEGVGTEVSESNGGGSGTAAGDLEFSPLADLSWTCHTDGHLDQLTLELASRGPKQSEVKLRYLYQILSEAGCLEWCLLVAMVLRDSHAFTRAINLACLPDAAPDMARRMHSGMGALSRWVDCECLGYKPFMQGIQGDIAVIESLSRASIQSPAATTAATAAAHEVLTASAASPEGIVGETKVAAHAFTSADRKVDESKHSGSAAGDDRACTIS